MAAEPIKAFRIASKEVVRGQDSSAGKVVIIHEVGGQHQVVCQGWIYDRLIELQDEVAFWQAIIGSGIFDD